MANTEMGSAPGREAIGAAGAPGAAASRGDVVTGALAPGRSCDVGEVGAGTAARIGRRPLSARILGISCTRTASSANETLPTLAGLVT